MSPSSARRPGRRPAGGPRPLVSWLVVGGVVVAGLVAVLGLFDLVEARRDLFSARSRMEAARSAMSAHDVPGARRAIGQAEELVNQAAVPLRRPPLALLAPIPLVGSPVKALAGGARAGQEVLTASRILNEAAGAFPTKAEPGPDGHSLAAFHAAARHSEAAVAEADGHLESAGRVLEGALGAALPQVSGPARSMIETVDRTRAELSSVGRGLRILSGLTAPDTDARLLLLSQDTLELRAAGGFIGSYGVLHFAGGTVELERYDESTNLPPPAPHIDAPDELYGKVPYWDVSNSNWSPDFPTAAGDAAEIYRRQGGGEVAGVIAITERIMARLVGALGPVTLADYPDPVTEEGFAERVLYEVEEKRPLDVPRKKFLIDLAHEVFSRLFALPPDGLRGVVEAAGEAAGAGDLQVWFADPAWQREITGTALEGALPRGGGDFLLLADTNMSQGKANADLVRVVGYEVRREAAGDLIATLTMDYRNEGAKSRTNPYYNGYLRIYVPGGSELLDDGGAKSSVTEAPDGPYRVISVRIFVHPRDNQVLTFTYRLPGEVAADGRYRLTWLRQVGTPADRLTATVGARTEVADPARRRLEVTAELP